MRNEITMLHHEVFKSNCESNRFVVLLHGFGGNYRVWKNQIPLLQNYYNVLAVDLPSHYEGNVKLSSLKGDIESIVAEIRKVLDKYTIKQALFLGVSLGTVFIKYLELFFPQYVGDAILVGAFGTVGIFLHTVVNLFAKIGDKLPPITVYKIFGKVLMPWKICKKSREIFCECAKVLTAKEFKAYMLIFKEFFKFNKLFAKNEYENNLYVSGVGDVCFLKGVIKEAKKTASKIKLLENCGHVCNIDQKEQFNEILLRIARGECS